MVACRSVRLLVGIAGAALALSGCVHDKEAGYSHVDRQSYTLCFGGDTFKPPDAMCTETQAQKGFSDCSYVSGSYLSCGHVGYVCEFDCPEASRPYGDPADYCPSLIANTGNQYVPFAECVEELDAARMQCNATVGCVLTGWSTSRGGIGGTDACRDGGGDTGLRKWRCSGEKDIPPNLNPI